MRLCVMCLDMCEWKQLQTLVENRLVALALFDVTFLTLWGVRNQKPHPTHTSHEEAESLNLHHGICQVW